MERRSALKLIASRSLAGLTVYRLFVSPQGAGPKRNLTIPDGAKDFLTLSQLQQIYSGIVQALEDIEYWVESEIEKIDPDSWRNSLAR